MDPSMIWEEKYKPRTLGELSYEPIATNILQNLAKSDDFPHLIFYGIEGSGKKTRLHAFLEAVYGAGVRKVQTEMKEIKINSQKIEFPITSSNFHIEFTPSDLENKDKFLIQHIIKESAGTTQLNTGAQKKFKVIVLLEADNLTKDAQAALRRTMEKYSSNCRIIMSCVSLNKLIAPIRSRCLSIRVGSPDAQEIKEILKKITACESFSVSESQLETIAKNSEGNVRAAINCLQLTYIGKLSSGIFTPNYLDEIKKVYTIIKTKRNLEGIKELRTHFMDLMVGCIPTEIIFTQLTRYFLNDPKIGAKCKTLILNQAVLYDSRAVNGSKGIIHLEAFAANVMDILNSN